MKSQYKVLAEKYNKVISTFSEMSSVYYGDSPEFIIDRGELEMMTDFIKNLIEAPSFEEFITLLEQARNNQRLQFSIHYQFFAFKTVMNAIFKEHAEHFIELLQPALGAGESALDYKNHLQQLRSGVTFNDKQEASRRKFYIRYMESAEIEFKKFHTEYKKYKEAQEELYKNNPGVNIDI